jgi:hypothetical protein
MMLPNESKAKMELHEMVMLSWYSHVAETNKQKKNIFIS